MQQKKRYYIFSPSLSKPGNYITHKSTADSSVGDLGVLGERMQRWGADTNPSGTTKDLFHIRMQ